MTLAALSPLPTRTLRLYFIAELVATAILESVRHVPEFSWSDNWYRVLYCLCLAPVRLLACIVAARTSSWASLTVVPFAGILLWMGIRGIAGPPSADQWICLLDGVIVTAAGLGLALTAPFTYHRNLYGTLAVLWMLLGIFDFGYTLQPYGKWRELNDSLLPVMVIGAFGWIGLSGWSKKLKLRKEAL